MKFSRNLFFKNAEQALAEVPRAFRNLLTNLEIDVKASPGRESGKWKGSKQLLGLYRGLKREDMKSPFYGGYLPSRIVLYQRNIEALCKNEVALAERIRKTLKHEIAHHFGFSEEDIRHKWPDGA